MQSITEAGDRFWEVVRRVARETALLEIHFDIVPALGDDAPLWVQLRWLKICY
jgi:glucokinase